MLINYNKIAAYILSAQMCSHNNETDCYNGEPDPGNPRGLVVCPACFSTAANSNPPTRHDGPTPTPGFPSQHRSEPLLSDRAGDPPRCDDPPGEPGVRDIDDSRFAG